MLRSGFYSIITSCLIGLLAPYAMGADSTSLGQTTLKAADIPLKGYILYKSGNITIPNATDIDTARQYLVPMTCDTGYLGCVSIDTVIYNTLNTHVNCDTDLTNYANIEYYPRILNIPQGYKVSILFKGGQHKATPTGSGCDDRGGIYNYTVTCVPTSNVDPSAVTRTIAGITMPGTCAALP